MFNPFKRKTVTFKLSCKGYNRKFRVRTADGVDHMTVREDYISAFGYCPSFYLRSIKAEDLISCRDGIEVSCKGSASVYVKPVSIHLIKRTEIEVTEKIEQAWYVFKPKYPRESVAKYITVEVLSETGS